MAILVVDDSRAMRMIIRRELSRYGYHDVVEADNGISALETIEACDVDVVLSDWNMPGMNGMDLLAELRARGNEMAFGFVTSVAAEEAHARALGAGAQFVVTKPFTSECLGRHVDAALGTGGAGAVVPAKADDGVDGVLGRLFGRRVAAKACEPPRRGVARAVATYEIPGQPTPVHGVAEMTLAAALACALGRIPAGQAEEWTRAHAFNGTLEANFSEVANVMGRLAFDGTERCVLRKVAMLGEGEKPPALRVPGEWRTTVDVTIEGYPSGRLGFFAPHPAAPDPDPDAPGPGPGPGPDAAAPQPYGAPLER